MKEYTAILYKLQTIVADDIDEAREIATKAAEELGLDGCQDIIYFKPRPSSGKTQGPSHGKSAPSGPSVPPD